MKSLKPILLGMNNPQSTDPRHALHHSPPGCAGHRLWQMLSDAVPGGVTQRDYLRAFERRNLLIGAWDVRAARASARDLCGELLSGGRDRVIVVLGQAARRAVGLDELLLHPQPMHGVTWRQLPHPSGRCRWYNDHANRALAGALLAGLYEEVACRPIR